MFPKESKEPSSNKKKMSEIGNPNKFLRIQKLEALNKELHSFVDNHLEDLSYLVDGNQYLLQLQIHSNSLD